MKFQNCLRFIIFCFSIAFLVSCRGPDSDTTTLVIPGTDDDNPDNSEIKTPLNGIFVSNNSSLGGNGSSWEEALPTINDAIKISDGSKPIYIAAGLYNIASENIDITVVKSLIKIDKNNLKIYGGFSGNEQTLEERILSKYKTVIDGDSKIRLFELTADNLELNDITLQNATAKKFEDSNKSTKFESNPDIFGGAIQANEIKGLKLNNIIFLNNQAPYAGALVIYNSNDINLSNCQFIKNASSYSTGAAAVIISKVNLITITKASIEESEAGINSRIFQITDSKDITMSNIQASKNKNTVLYFDNCQNLTLDSCIFANNNPRNGAVVDIRHTAAILNGSQFSNNISETEPGALVLLGASGTYIKKTLFLNNQTKRSMSRGAGISASGSDNLTIDSCTFTNNKSVLEEGGAIDFIMSKKFTISNSTFKSNGQKDIAVESSSSGNGMNNQPKIIPALVDGSSSFIQK
jgi:hypothetical protein